MCGIAGIFKHSGGQHPSLKHDVKNMLSVIKHRGPDESGIYVNKQLAIGNVRLSIIDIQSGQQPLADESGNFWIVFNGEIFNYQELRVDLIKKGIKLKTHSDTEVLVQLYALYGEKCLQMLNGQFAFSIWDKKNKSLFLARDRVGIRPLFYWKTQHSFAFCSEIKGLFTVPKIEKKLNNESMAQIFTFWSSISPNTPFENIYELPPGHFMKISSSSFVVKRYWSLGYKNKTRVNSKTMDESVEELTELFRDAIKLRLRADVPVGAYLSGGLDSSVTTAFIKEFDPNILNTFSIGFADQVFDETTYQEEAAAFFGTRHTAYKCTSQEIANNFSDTIYHTESPILRTSPTPMYLLSKKVRESNIKVVITGEGADEMFAGYNIFKEAKIRKFWANQPDSRFRPQLLHKLYPYLPMMKDSGNMALKMFFGYKLKETNDPLYSHLLRWNNTSRIKAYFSDEFGQSIKNYNPVEGIAPTLPEDFENWTDLDKAQYLEASIFMSGYLLSSQGDRMAMANSVEGRYPFLDHRVIEFSSQLPDRFKLNCLNEKFILKKMSRGKIPDSIGQRSKQAYRAPIASSFFDENAAGFIGEMLSDKSIHDSGIFDPNKVAMLINKIKAQKNVSEIDQMAIAAILSTQLLNKLFIQQPILLDADNFTLNTLIEEE